MQFLLVFTIEALPCIGQVDSAVYWLERSRTSLLHIDVISVGRAKSSLSSPISSYFIPFWSQYRPSRRSEAFRMLEAGLEPNIERGAQEPKGFGARSGPTRLSCRPFEVVFGSKTPQAAAPEQRSELESAWIERLQSKGGLDREVYKAILRVEARLGNLPAASEWFRKMGEKGFERFINEHNELLKVSEPYNFMLL